MDDDPFYMQHWFEPYLRRDGRDVEEVMRDGLEQLQAGATRLSLRERPLTDVHAQTLAGVLTSNQTLTHLNLSGPIRVGDNLIGPIGAGALATALRTNATLTHLDLSWNPIGDEGA